MGNRSYFMIKTVQEQANGMQYEILFEGNNSLAHFWLMALERSDLEKLRQPFRNEAVLADILNENPATPPIIIKDKTEALQLLENRKAYISEVYPNLLPLYEDWLLYLKYVQPIDNEFHIDIWNLSAFELSTDVFIDGLLSFYDVMERKERCFQEDIPSSIGWQGWNIKEPMTHFSEVYEKKLEKELPTYPKIANQPIPIRIRGKSYPKLILYQIRLFCSYAIAIILLLAYYFRYPIPFLQEWLVVPFNGWLVIPLWIAIVFFLFILPYIIELQKDKYITRENAKE